MSRKEPPVDRSISDTIPPPPQSAHVDDPEGTDDLVDELEERAADQVNSFVHPGHPRPKN